MANEMANDKPALGGVMGFVIDLARGRSAARAERSMKVLETLQLGGRRQLMLVRCGQQQFLVGAGVDGVQTIVAVAANEVPR
jgi:flagellar biogenesis protein FliO